MRSRLFLAILCGILSSTPLISIVKSNPLHATQVVENSVVKFNTKLEVMDELREKAIQKRIEDERIRLEEIEIARVEDERLRLQEIENKKEYWTFEVSYYDSDWQCTQNGNGQTASGEYAQEGVTIALPSDIPFGTRVWLGDEIGWRINQDLGGFIQYTTDEQGNKVMRVDVYVSLHSTALRLGRHYVEGYLIRN